MAKFTTKVKQTIFRCIRRGMSQQSAARRAGIHRVTIQRWLKLGSVPDAMPEYRRFWIKYREAEQDAIDALFDRFDMGTVKDVTETIVENEDGSKTTTRREITHSTRDAAMMLRMRFKDYREDVEDDYPDDEDEVTIDPIADWVGSKDDSADE